MTEELWHRHAELVGVNYPERTIEVVVMPYDVEAEVVWKGRRVTESIAPGAFDGIERRANRIRANRDHDVTRTFGRAIAMHPSRAEGLVAEIKVAKTPLGDESLELAEDGVLEASAGFRPMDGGMQWLTRTAYRVVKGWLGHIALVPEGVYGEHAPVLAVRSPETIPPASATPNLDLFRAQRLEDRLAALVASDPKLSSEPLNYQP